jgi:hypothetical protein
MPQVVLVLEHLAAEDEAEPVHRLNAVLERQRGLEADHRDFLLHIDRVRLAAHHLHLQVQHARLRRPASIGYVSTASRAGAAVVVFLVGHTTNAPPPIMRDGALLLLLYIALIVLIHQIFAQRARPGHAY